MCTECVPRLNQILHNLRLQNNGADIHEVQTIRHIAVSLIRASGKDPDYVCRATEELERRHIEFFKKKLKQGLL